MAAETKKPSRRGGRLPREEEDERIAFAVTCIRATPDAYQQAKTIMRKFGVKRRRATKWLEQARIRIRRNLDIAWPTVAGELWSDVRDGIAACRAKGDYGTMFKGLDVAAKLLPLVEPAKTAGDVEDQVTEIRFKIREPETAGTDDADSPAGNGTQPQAG